MDASSKQRRPRRSLLSPSRLLALLLLVVGAMVLLGMRKGSLPQSGYAARGMRVLREGRGEATALASRALHSVAHITEHRRRTHHMPRPPTHKHEFLLLEPGPSGSSQDLRDLQPYLEPYRRHPDAITITQLAGPAAVSLGAQFLLPQSSLPAVVYLPPMWETGGGFRNAATFVIAENPAGAGGFPAWLKRTARMTILLMNDWDDNQVCFYLVDEYEKKEVEVGCPETQREMWLQAGLLDHFTARNKSNQGLLAQRVALYSGLFVVHPPDFCNYLVDSSCEMETLPHPTDANVLAIRDSNNNGRLAAMQSQPKNFKHYTTIGFEKRRAPPELYEAYAGYLNASWDSMTRELWAPTEIFTNHFDSPSLKVTLPEIGPLKPRLFNIVRQILEEWIGGDTPLESTAMYGIRVYSRGNILNMHCDRPDTHIISAIINVQQDVEAPWPLQIKDHLGKKHSVVMEPGDMVMYEGATCAHGREEPLFGRYFANVFVHFKPRQGARA